MANGIFVKALVGALIAIVAWSVWNTMWAEAALRADQFQFLAYDCSNPVKMSSVAPPEQQDCETQPEGKEEVEKTYTLLQKAEYSRIKGYSCEVKMTRVAFYCGVYGHQTFVPQAARFWETVPVSRSDCEMMHKLGDRGLFGIPGKDFEIRTGHTNYLNYERVGRTYFTNTDVTCEGEMWRDQQGHARNGINMYEAYQVTVLETDFMVDDFGNVIVEKPQISLTNCPFSNGYCENQGGLTYTWKVNGPYGAQCRYFKIRQVTGKEVMGTDGNTVFMSTDGSMTRLIKKSPKTACDQAVFATNYQRLFLTEEHGNHLFNRDLPFAEMSVTMYSNNKDDFLYGTLTNYVQEEYLAVLQEDCRRQKESRQTDFSGIAAEQAAVGDGETASLGHGWFVTAAGEGWYRYQCLHVLVTAREDTECWAGLPVTLDDKDRFRYLAQHHEAGYPQTAENQTAFFIEPHTRRLTTIGVPMPCVDILAPIYEDSKGRWIKVTPRIELANPPERLEPGEFRPAGSAEITELDFEGGGIYEAEAIRAMDKFNQAPRLHKAVNHELATFRSKDGQSYRYTPHDLFPQIPEVDFDFFGRFWRFVDRWGRWLSLFLLIVTVFKLLTAIIGFFFRCNTARRHRGGLLAFLLALFPSALHDVLDRVVDLRQLQGGEPEREPTPEGQRHGGEDKDATIDRRTHPHARVADQVARLLDEHDLDRPNAPEPDEG